MRKVRIVLVSFIISLVFSGCGSVGNDSSSSTHTEQVSAEQGQTDARVTEESVAESATEIEDEFATETTTGPAADSELEPFSMPALLGKMKLDYATEFSVDLYEQGYALIQVTDGNSYILVPEGLPACSLGLDNATVLQMPCESIYLAASSAMDLFHELAAVDQIKSCSTKAEDYANAQVGDLIASGQISYVGKYSAPDYEKLIALHTNLAIESTMIYHSPKIKEELEALSIPVFVERSSYESHPLGRLEWIKLYGLLLGKEELAETVFANQVAHVNAVISGLANQPDEVPKVCFFYLSSNGYVNVRKPGDYVSKMIEIAGGEYALSSLKVEEENALSTVNVSWEDFYYYGKDADILLYNGTIDGGISAIDDLIRQNALFKEFKAVQNQKVYCIQNNMYQESSKTGDMIAELSAVMKGIETDLQFIHKVN